MDIYSIGGGEIVYEVLSAVTRCLHGDNGSLLQASLRIGMIVGAFMLYMSVITNNWAEIVKTWMAPIAFIMYVFFLPTTTVWVHDDISKFHKKLDNVPYGLGMFASYSSTAGKYITEKIETNFSTPDDLRYHKTGMMFGSDILEKSKSFKITNTNFKENMRNFVGQCVKYDIMLNDKYTYDQLKNSSDIWGLVSSADNASVNRGIFWIPLEGGRSEYVTCAGAVKKFNESWKAEIDKTSFNLGLKMFSGRAIGHSTLDGKFKVSKALANTLKGEIIKNLKSTYEYFGELQQSSEELMKQNMMANAIEDAASHNSHLSGNSLAFAEAKALFQQRSTYETLGRMASKVLPIMKAVLEALVYACFIFIVPLCMIPNGYKFLINWCGTLIWLQAWAPMYAVLNYIMSVAARSSTLAEIGLSGGITIANMAGVSEANADMRTLAGYLALSIPFICIAIVNGVGTFVHLAGQLTGATTQAGSAAAAEVAGGNFSFGNVSVGNQQMGNVSQLQRNFSSSLSGADHMLMNGVEQIRYGNDGSRVFSSQYSSGKIDGSFDTSEAVAQSMAIQSINSALRSNETALTESDSIREGRGWDALQQISKSNQNIEQHSDTTTSSHSESAHNLIHVLEGHGDRADYSHGNSTTLGTSLGFGGGKGSGFPLGVSGSTQAQASNAENLSEFVQTQEDGSYKIDHAALEQKAKQVMNSDASSETKSAMSKYLESAEKSNDLTESRRHLQQTQSSLQESYNASKNSSFNIRNKGMRDDVIEELVKRNNISHEEANRQIDSNSLAAQAAIRTVQDQKMHSIPRTHVAYNTFNDFRDNVKNEFAENKQKFENKTDIKGKTEHLEEFDGLRHNPNDFIKEDVIANYQATNQKIAEEKSKIEGKTKKVKAKVDDRSGDGTNLTALKQVGKNFKNINPASKSKEIDINN